MSDSRKINAILFAITLLCMIVCTLFCMQKQGYHEDELLAFHLANSAKQLELSGSWNSREDLNAYLAVAEDGRFDYAQVLEMQITDSHPPLYFLLVHTICSFFPGTFSKWLTYGVNIAALVIILILCYKIGYRVTKDARLSLLGTVAYAGSIACVTTVIFLRMYALLTCFVLAFVYLTLKLCDEAQSAGRQSYVMLGLITMLGCLTHYYFALFAGATGLIFLILKIRKKDRATAGRYCLTACVGALAAFCVYPYMITNIFSADRGIGMWDMDIDAITVVTYGIYKFKTYLQIIAKELFWENTLLMGGVILFLGVGAICVRLRGKRLLSEKSRLIVFPPLLYVGIVAMISPFNTDRYIMPAFPFLAMLLVLAPYQIWRGLCGKRKAEKNRAGRRRMRLAAVFVVAYSMVGLLTVTPYYLYGKTNLYEPVTERCIFIGTPAMEWNKSIDKLMQYDEVMILQTADIRQDLDEFADQLLAERGVITNGKVASMLEPYLVYFADSDGETEWTETLKEDTALQNLSEVTVYISRLTDEEKVLSKLLESTHFDQAELIQADYDENSFFNWYDYFVQTESYCNVYRLFCEAT